MSKTVDLSNEPISSIGHGALFDQKGREIQVTPEFAKAAENFYVDALLKIADAKQLAAYQKKRKRLLEGKTWDVRSELFMESELLENVMKEVRPVNADEISGKIALLRQRALRGFEPPISLKQLLVKEGIK